MSASPEHRDPWHDAPASWRTLPKDVAQAWPELARKPWLWEEIVNADDRAHLAAVALDIVTARPDISPFAFTPELLDRLRARGDQRLVHEVSMHAHRVPDFLARVQRLAASNHVESPR